MVGSETLKKLQISSHDLGHKAVAVYIGALDTTSALLSDVPVSGQGAVLNVFNGIDATSAWRGAVGDKYVNPVYGDVYSFIAASDRRTALTALDGTPDFSAGGTALTRYGAALARHDISARSTIQLRDTPGIAVTFPVYNIFGVDTFNSDHQTIKVLLLRQIQAQGQAQGLTQGQVKVHVTSSTDPIILNVLSRLAKDATTGTQLGVEGALDGMDAFFALNQAQELDNLSAADYPAYPTLSAASFKLKDFLPQMSYFVDGDSKDVVITDAWIRRSGAQLTQDAKPTDDVVSATCTVIGDAQWYGAQVQYGGFDVKGLFPEVQDDDIVLLEVRFIKAGDFYTAFNGAIAKHGDAAAPVDFNASLGSAATGRRLRSEAIMVVGTYDIFGSFRVTNIVMNNSRQLTLSDGDASHPLATFAQGQNGYDPIASKLQIVGTADDMRWALVDVSQGAQFQNVNGNYKALEVDTEFIGYNTHGVIPAVARLDDVCYSLSVLGQERFWSILSAKK